MEILPDVMASPWSAYSFGSVTYDLSARTYIMGILNVTPDSFSDGGKFVSPAAAVDFAVRISDEGADFIDVGGESSRPGSDAVPADEELRRVIPVIERIVTRTKIPVSIDTTKSRVAEEALKAGAVIVNDISGLTADRRMAEVAAKAGASVVIMHMKGTPKTMQEKPEYEDVVGEVRQFLERQAGYARTRGIDQILIDPGIGFGKNLGHNLRLIRELESLGRAGFPILVGPSRKSFVGALLDLPVGDRLEGTAAAVTACVLHGASVVRVHDVKEMKRVAIVADAIRRSR